MNTKTALITGATTGIGRALVTCFAKDSYNLIIVARNEKNLLEVQRDIEKTYNINVVVIACDLSLPGAALDLYSKIKDLQIDVLVNNAGFAVYAPFIDNNYEAMIGSIRLNMETLTGLTRLILPDMLSRGKGIVLNVASTASFQPGPLMAVYYATKAYVLSFSEALRYELRNTAITITTLCPGATDTEFQKKSGFGASNLVKLGMMSSEEVAEAGFRGMKRGTSIVIPGLKNKFSAFIVRFSPRNIVLSVVYKLNKAD